MSNSNKIKGISRRDFLKGTAAGALGVAAAGLLGGCTSTPEKQECPPCEPTSSASSAGWPAVEALEPKVPMEGVVAFVKEPIADSEIVKTENVDVVVCGMGPAGFAASIASAQQGLKTVVLEKGQVGTYRSATIGGLTDRIHKIPVSGDERDWTAIRFVPRSASEYSCFRYPGSGETAARHYPFDDEPAGCQIPALACQSVSTLFFLLSFRTV